MTRATGTRWPARSATGHAETWYAAEATLGWRGPDGARRLAVATADPGTLPGKAKLGHDEELEGFPFTARYPHYHCLDKGPTGLNDR